MRVGISELGVRVSEGMSMGLGLQGVSGIYLVFYMYFELTPAENGACHCTTELAKREFLDSTSHYQKRKKKEP